MISKTFCWTLIYTTGWFSGWRWDASWLRPWSSAGAHHRRHRNQRKYPLPHEMVRQPRFHLFVRDVIHCRFLQERLWWSRPGSGSTSQHPLPADRHRILRRKTHLAQLQCWRQVSGRGKMAMATVLCMNWGNEFVTKGTADDVLCFIRHYSFAVSFSFQR